MAGPWLHIGRVVAVNAARRQLRIAVAPGCACEFDGRDRFWLGSGADTPAQVCASSARQTGGDVTVELTPGVSRDMAAGFKNATVMIPASASCRKAGVHAGLHDLPGMRVVTATGGLVGSVTEVMETPGGGIMRLRCAGTKLATAPVTDAFIRDIDLDAGVIVVNEPDYFVVFDDDDPAEKPSRDAAEDGS